MILIEYLSYNGPLDGINPNKYILNLNKARSLNSIINIIYI
jgi:hypothetical protein